MSRLDPEKQINTDEDVHWKSDHGYDENQNSCSAEFSDKQRLSFVERTTRAADAKHYFLLPHAIHALSSDIACNSEGDAVWKIAGHGIRQHWVELDYEMDDPEWTAMKASGLLQQAQGKAPGHSPIGDVIGKAKDVSDASSRSAEKEPKLDATGTAFCIFFAD